MYCIHVHVLLISFSLVSVEASWLILVLANVVTMELVFYTSLLHACMYTLYSLFILSLSLSLSLSLPPSLPPSPVPLTRQSTRADSRLTSSVLTICKYPLKPHPLTLPLYRDAASDSMRLLCLQKNHREVSGFKVMSISTYTHTHRPTCA